MVHFAGSGGVSQMLNLSIFIIWTKSKVTDLRMLSAGLHHALSHLNMSATMLDMVIFDGELLFFVAPEGCMDKFLFYIISFSFRGNLLE